MTDDLVGLERWPGYERQSWAERFAELDRQTSARCNTLQNAIIAMSAQHAARIEALEAEKAEWLGIMRHLVDGRGRDLARAIIAKEDANVRP